MSQVTQCADRFLDFSQSSLVLLFHLGDLGFETLTCVFNTGVDCLQRVWCFAPMTRKLAHVSACA